MSEENLKYRISELEKQIDNLDIALDKILSRLDALEEITGNQIENKEKEN